MKIKEYISILIIIVTFFGFISGKVKATEVIDFVQAPQLSFEDRIEAALRLALKKYDGKEIWVAYSIDSLIQLDSRANLNQEASVFSLLRQSMLIDSVRHRYLILLDYSLESGYPYLHQVHINQVPHDVVYHRRPVVWLGKQKGRYSLIWLKKQFCKSRYELLSKQIVNSIGLHTQAQEVIDFNRAILFSQFPDALKYEAINGLGRHHTLPSIRVLIKILNESPSVNIQKRAISVLSQMKDKRARKIVYALAKRGKNPVLRKEAIFWLSHMATEEAIDVLNYIVVKETDVSLKEYAIFAIGQLPGGQGNAILCHIANNNSNPRMREKAKFWMGQSQDHRLFQLLNDLSETETVK